MEEKISTSASIRAFIAAGISAEVRSRISGLQTRLKKTEAGVKWVNVPSIHLTLRFLGNIGEDQIGPAVEAMAEAAAGRGPITVEVRGWGTYPPERRPRVLWLGLGQGAPELEAIFNALEQSLLSRGFGPADKKFSPHLTLGRVKSGRGMGQVFEIMKREAEKSFGEYIVGHITLFQSRLHPAGSVYTVLGESGLHGG